MFIQSIRQIQDLVPAETLAVLRLVENELNGTSVYGNARRLDMQKIRDQLSGAPAATTQVYHPDQYGLNADQQAHFRRILARSHVNLVEPALDRLVNSIHSGKIQRRVIEGFSYIQEMLNGSAHAAAMTKLCENAFAYGTGYLVPVAVEGRVNYWLPDPLHTYMAVNPADITDILGIVEILPAWSGALLCVRYVTKTHIGVAYVKTGTSAMEIPEPEYTEHGFPFLPVVVAYGRDQTHRGEKYGKSFVSGVADATIRVTNNEVNLELLRDRQTQALLVTEGEPTRTSADDQGAQGKYISFPRDGGDAKYITPESRLEAVIELTKRFCADAAVSSGLPLDTFLPELIAGSDASATAARIRAFPLQQRMIRIVRDWEMVEERAAVVTSGAVMQAGGVYFGEGLEDLRNLLQPRVKILPSLPEADAETLSNWQQKTANFMAPIEAAIEFYSEDLPDEEKKRLALAWRIKNDPTMKTNGEVFAYHIEGGVLKINEIRALLGFPPVEFGEMTVPEKRTADAEAAALRASAIVGERTGGTPVNQ